MLDDQSLHDVGLEISKRNDAADGSMALAEFVESKFIPNHVELKGPAGRIHYHSILKHVMTPDLVDRLFAPYRGDVKGRLRALSGWPYLDHVRIGEIGPEHVRRLIHSATEHGYSYQTIKHIRNVVSCIFNHARRERVFNGDNPVSEVDLHPTPRSPQQTVSIRHGGDPSGARSGDPSDIVLPQWSPDGARHRWLGESERHSIAVHRLRPALRFIQAGLPSEDRRGRADDSRYGPLVSDSGF